MRFLNKANEANSIADRKQKKRQHCLADYERFHKHTVSDHAGVISVTEALTSFSENVGRRANDRAEGYLLAAIALPA